MRRNIFSYYEAHPKAVFNSYKEAVTRLFCNDCTCEEYHQITFPLTYSFKYNINGGTCHIHIIPYKTGTAVLVRYTVIQAFGANVQKHNSDLCREVFNYLHVSPQIIDNIPEEAFLNDDNKLFGENVNRGVAKQTSVKKEENNQNDAAAEIMKYKNLLDCGAISQEEYEAKKKQLLNL